MRNATLPAALAAALFPGASALAQPTFDGRIAFRWDHNLSTVPTIANGGDYILSFGGQNPPVTRDFAVMIGVFDTQGFDNRGMFSFRGDITISHPNFTITNTFGNPPLGGARAPFNFSPAANGTLAADGLGIDDLDLVRNPLLTVAWPLGGPPPEPDTPQGRGQYYSAFRFTVTAHDNADAEVHVNVNGVLTVIAGFHLLGGEEGDVANWVAGPLVSTPVSGSFTIVLIPAPASLPILALAGVVATRRRRRPM